MDKLRALQYFVAAAEERSFSAAARRLDVSIPAVAKLVASLEQQLGTRLFERNARGLALTADGETYLEGCGPALDQVAAADSAVSGAITRARGIVVIAMEQVFAQHCLLPKLPAFHARHPEIQIDLRNVGRLTDRDAGSADVLVLIGWPEASDLVQRQVAQNHLLICAAPAYWAVHGVPQRPQDLAAHICLLFRNPDGTVQDLWTFEREGVKESAAVRSWLVSSHRDVLLDAALAGEGVARMGDLSIREHLRSGRLVPALRDWRAQDARPISLFYRSHSKRTPRVRLVIDFIADVFRKLEATRDVRDVAFLRRERPRWWGHHGRASAAVYRGRRPKP